MRPNSAIARRSRRWFPRYVPAHEEYAHRAAELARPNSRILHLGAGRDVHRIAGRLPTGTLISLDPDRAGLLANPSRLRVTGDGGILPFQGDTFDLILAENVFEHLEDPAAVLRECARCLKSEGALLFLCPNRLSYIAVLSAVTPYRFHVWWRGLSIRTAESDTFRTYYRLNTARRIRRLARASGLDLVELQTLVGWPSYWKFSDLLHRIMVLAHKGIERGPSLFHITLIGVLEKARGTDPPKAR